MNNSIKKLEKAEPKKWEKATETSFRELSR